MSALAWKPTRLPPGGMKVPVTSVMSFVLALRRATALPGPGAVSAPPSGMQNPIDTASQAARDERLAALLRSAAKGDARAFEQFYAGTVAHALPLVRRIAREHAEDVLADAYFQAWQSAARFDAARGSPMGWLLTIARSRALDRLRQEVLRHGGLSGAPEHDGAQEPDPAPGPDALLESVQAHTLLHRALAALSANERWVLGLAYFRGCSQAEVAAITGLPLGTVKSLITRSQHKLRQALQNEHQPTPVALAR